MSRLDRIDKRAERMGRMMRIVGVDEFADTGLKLERELRAAFARCQGCRATEECDGWLERNREGAPAPEFCPNAAYFTANAGRGGTTAS